MYVSDSYRSNEHRRLDTVRRYLELDAGNAALDRVAALGARAFKTPMAAVAFVGDDAVWFKGRHGLDMKAVGLSPGLCATAVHYVGSYVLFDTHADPRASKHPLVVGDPWLRFYAAASIIVDGGEHIGTVCVMDTSPRSPTADQLATLRDLAATVADDLQMRREAVDVLEDEQRARRRLQKETDRIGYIANTLQDSLTPSRLPVIPGLDISALYQPYSSDKVGGDFFDVFPIDGDGRWGVFVGDVVGKGVEAAAFTPMARYSLRAAAVVEPDPAKVLSAVNEAVMLDPASGENLYCTVAYGELVCESDGVWSAKIALGGHPPPIILRRGGDVETVSTGGTIVGVFPGSTYTAGTTTLSAGDTVVFYSDGVTDLREKGGWLGVDGMIDAIKGVPANSANDAIDLLRTIITSDGRELLDDLVILAISVPRRPHSKGHVTLDDKSR